MNDIFGPGRQPRYARVAASIMRSISDGSFPVGELLPAEAALCERFSVSRATVREALRQLSDLGLIEKVHGIGTRVVSTEAHSNFLLSANAIGFMQYGSQTALELISREEIVIKEGDGTPRGLNAGERWLRLRGIRHMSGESEHPFAFSEILLSARFAGVAPDLIAGDRPYHQLIADRYGEAIHSIDQEIRAVEASGEEAKCLKVDEHTACLQIVRWFRGSEGKLFEVTINTHPGSRFTYKLHLDKAP